MGFSRFFLNRGITESPVQAPALSRTEVMAAVPLLTAVVTALTAGPASGQFTSTGITTLLVVLIGFRAVTGAADVPARAVAASARQASTSAAQERLIRLPALLAAAIATDGAHPPLSVVDTTAGSECLCVRTDGSVTREPADTIRFDAAVPPCRAGHNRHDAPSTGTSKERT